MRIANIFEEGKLGGPQVYIIRLASSLRDKVDMTLIIPDENSDSFRAQCDATGLEYKTMKISRITKEWKVAVRYLMLFPWEVMRLIKLFGKSNYDVVYICGGSWQYKGAIAGKLAGKKVLWHINDTFVPWVFRKMFSLLSPLADGYVYASERSRSYYSPLVNKDKPEFVIPAPVDTTFFDPHLQHSREEQLVRQWSGKIVVGTVANINPIKGLEIFIRMAAASNIQADNLHFVVVGEIYKVQRLYFLQLQQLCNRLGVGNIEFVGGRSDVRPLLQRFDIYVCSSWAESSPLSVWEAMAMEKPIISTNVGDVSLHVRDGHNGFIADIGGSVVISERLITLVNEEGMRREFGRRSREIAVRELNITQCAKSHLDAYTRIVS